MIKWRTDKPLQSNIWPWVCHVCKSIVQNSCDVCRIFSCALNSFLTPAVLTFQSYSTNKRAWTCFCFFFLSLGFPWHQTQVRTHTHTHSGTHRHTQYWCFRWLWFIRVVIIFALREGGPVGVQFIWQQLPLTDTFFHSFPHSASPKRYKQPNNPMESFQEDNESLFLFS